jgi:Spy/CpxP family protein refolding chaperone
MTRTTDGLLVSALLLVLLWTPPVQADPTMDMGPPRGPTFLRQLFLPTAVMRYQTEIGLTDTQRDAITAQMTEAHKRALDLRWQLEAKDAAFGKLLGAEKVDEQAAMSQATDLMRIEEQMKRVHLELLIRVKNVLTPEQQAKLRRLAPFPRGRFARGGPDAGPPDDDLP